MKRYKVSHEGIILQGPPVQLPDRSFPPTASSLPRWAWEDLEGPEMAPSSAFLPVHGHSSGYTTGLSETQKG